MALSDSLSMLFRTAAARMQYLQRYWTHAGEKRTRR